MNTPRDDDMPADESGLSPEERALAQRLSQLDARAAPSPALDARILAAARGLAPQAEQADQGHQAHAAKASPAQPSLQAQRRRPRWQLPVGIAASLALAIGMAWQLRPQPETHLEYHAPAAGPSAQTVAETKQAAAADAIAPPSATAPAADTVATEATAEPARPAPRQRAPAQPTADLPATSAEEASDVRRQADTVSAPAAVMAPPPPPPPPAPPAPRALVERAVVAEPVADTAPRFAPSPAEAKAAAQADAFKAEAERSEAAQPQRAARNQAAPVPQAAPAATPSAAPVLDSISVTGSRVRSSKRVVDTHHDQPMDDQPPATVDSPEVRKAWLQRVRELHEDGHLDEARASLREFRRRYPDATLPDDLRPLLDE